MSTIFVWTMTLMPALVSLAFIIGIPIAIAALLLPEKRLHTRQARSAPGSRVPAGYVRDIFHRPRHPEEIGGRRKALPA